MEAAREDNQIALSGDLGSLVRSAISSRRGNPALKPRWLGRIDFQEARYIQDKLVRERKQGLSKDSLLLCEHPPTLSLGPRTNAEDLQVSLTELSNQGVKIERVNRGGAITYHHPGQLVLYPVVSLRECGIGVREFVLAGLRAISIGLNSHGISAEVQESPAGVWLKPCPKFSRAKVASVGLKIESGVTNHGFSLNICGNLAPTKYFNCCGQQERQRNISDHLTLQNESIPGIIASILDSFEEGIYSLSQIKRKNAGVKEWLIQQ